MRPRTGHPFTATAFCLLAALSLAQQSANTSSASHFSGSPNGNAPASEVSNVNVHTLLYPGATTRIYVRLMPFFVRGGGGGHIDVGYDSDDRDQVSAQLRDMKARGVDGVILDWYGPLKDHHERVAQELKEESEEQGLDFALSLDVGGVKNCRQSTHQTDEACLISELRYAHQHYFGSPAYMRRPASSSGRPVIFFFGLHTRPIDWKKVRRDSAPQALFVFRNSGAFDRADSDGGFAWIGDSSEPRNGMEYLDRFYRKALARAAHQPTLIFGSAYKGFDDSLASWGRHKLVPQDCGRTWLDTFRVVNHYFSAHQQLSDLQLLTWNDYEEGTELETGIDNCVELKASITGDGLQWQIGQGYGPAIDHFDIFATDPRDAKLRLLATLPRDKRRLRLEHLSPGAYNVTVKAVGAPFFQDRTSSPVSFPASRTQADGSH